MLNPYDQNNPISSYLNSMGGATQSLNDLFLQTPPPAVSPAPARIISDAMNPYGTMGGRPRAPQQQQYPSFEQFVSRNYPNGQMPQLPIPQAMPQSSMLSSYRPAQQQQPANPGGFPMGGAKGGMNRPQPFSGGGKGGSQPGYSQSPFGQYMGMNSFNPYQ